MDTYFVHCEMFADIDPQYWRPNDDPVIWLVAFVIGTIGNCDLLANIKRHQQTKQTFLTNLIAADIVAIVCIPVHYFHQSCRGCGLGLVMRMVFWISRDLATGVQIFSVVVLSGVRFQEIWSRGKYVSRPASAHADGVAVREAPHVHLCGRDVPVIATWIVAACCSLRAAVASNTLCFIHSDDVFEDANIKRVVILHLLAFRLFPLVCAVFLHIFTEFQRHNSPYSIQTMNDDGKLIFWLILIVTINYLPSHGWILHSLSQSRVLTTAAVDNAMYFPLYSTACCIPVVVFYTATATRFGRIQTV